MENTSSSKQNGSILIVIISIIIIVLLATVGYIYWSKMNTSKSDNSQTASTQDTKKAVEAPNENKEQGFLVIEEWGVKVKMRDAPKVQYELIDHGMERTHDAGTFRLSVKMSVKPDFLQDKKCHGATLEMVQLRSYNKDSGWAAREVNGKYYLITGSPYICDGGDGTPDNQLGKRILEDFSINNLESI